MAVFYVGLNPRYQYFTWLPEGLNVMYSAGGFWSGRRGPFDGALRRSSGQAQDKGWRRDKFMPWAGLRFLDCGGFTLLNKHGDYPFGVVEYMNLVARLRPDYYATMDYPCEPEISRKLGLSSNHERIRATVFNAVEILRWSAGEDGSLHVPGQAVPVIQGYSLAEYILCLNLHAAFETIRPYMAVGSMCRRMSSSEIGELVRGIYGHAKKLGVERLHFFGLKLSSDLQDLGEYIYSRDSAVIYDDYNSELRKKRSGRRFPRGPQEKREAVESFLGRLDQLGFEWRKPSVCDVRA